MAAKIPLYSISPWIFQYICFHQGITNKYCTSLTGLPLIAWINSFVLPSLSSSYPVPSNGSSQRYLWPAILSWYSDLNLIHPWTAFSHFRHWLVFSTPNSFIFRWLFAFPLDPCCQALPPTPADYLWRPIFLYGESMVGIPALVPRSRILNLLPRLHCFVPLNSLIQRWSGILPWLTLDRANNGLNIHKNPRFSHSTPSAPYSFLSMCP